MHARLLLLFVVGGLLLAATAGATSLGVESIGDGTPTASQQARGYRFRAESALVVSGLALYDVGGDGIGLEGPYGLHLWTDTGSLLASATLGHGAAAPLQGGFRVVAIPALRLSAGEIYRLSVDFGAGAGGAELLLNPTGVVTHDAITLIANVGEAPAGPDDFGLLGPDGSFPTAADHPTLGPNIVFSLVPEPTTGALVALGCVALALARRTRRPA